MTYEKFVKTTDLKDGQHDINFYIDGMNEEHGEISGVLKRIRRGDYNEYYDAFISEICQEMGLLYVLQNYPKIRLDLEKEIGDRHWYTTRLLQLIYGKDEVWYRIEGINTAKLKDRKNKNKIMGKGDNR